MTDIAKLLGSEASTLLDHRCQTIPRDSIYLPGSDFVNSVIIDNDRR